MPVSAFTWQTAGTLGNCAANCLFVLSGFFVFFFSFLDVTQLFKLLLLRTLTLSRTSDLKTMSLMVYDYLYTHMGCLQHSLFLTFDPVSVAPY